jgi:hypothetical protein
MGLKTDPLRQKKNLYPNRGLIVIDMYISKMGLTTNSLLGKNQFLYPNLECKLKHNNSNGEVEEEDMMMNTTYSFCTQSFFPQP